MTRRSNVRASREGWARDCEVVLTERCLDVLYLVGVEGIVRTKDIVRFAFGARSTANVRLRKLYVAGYLHCFAPDPMRDNYYALTPRGREMLVAAWGLDPERLRVVTKLPKKLEHALAITDLRLHLALACRASSRYTLVRFERDADLAQERHRALLELVPDARVTIANGQTGLEDTLFLEADLGTESVTWLVAHKLRVYARYAVLRTALYGVLDPLVILVVPGLRRARTIARALVTGRVGARVVLALAGELSEGNVLGRAYATPEDLLLSPPTDDLHTLFPRALFP